MLLTRRSLLATAAPAALAIGLAGCGTTISGITNTVTTVGPTVIAALQALGTMFAQVVPQLAPFGLTGTSQSEALSIISTIESALSGVGSTLTLSQGQSILTVVENSLNTLAPIILAAIPAAALAAIPGGSIIGLIVAALPAIEAGVNFLVSLIGQAASSLKTSAPALPASSRFKALATGSSQQYMNLLIQRASAASRYHHR